jgi:hypothetical protein
MYLSQGCPCGFLGDPTRECTCSAGAVARYQERISGPLLDRIDMRVDVPRVEYEKLTDARDAERSADVRARVRAARLRQAERFAGTDGARSACNADMGPAEVRAHCVVAPDAEPLLKAATQRLQLSARVPPCAEAGAHRRRPGWQRDHRRAAPGRGAAIPPPSGCRVDRGRESHHLAVLVPLRRLGAELTGRGATATLGLRADRGAHSVEVAPPGRVIPVGR